MTRDASKEIFDSEFNYQKIAKQGKQTNNIPSFAGSPTVITIPHNLGYIPSVRAWYEPGNGRRYIAANMLFQDSNGTGTDHTNGVTAAYIYLTTTNLVIGYANLTASTKSVTTYYRIYHDK